jgi:hypothetical protein
VRAYAAAGRRGRILKLRYRVLDDRGQTSERISVYRGRRLVKTISRALRTTENSFAYWVTWRAPRARVAGRFCVRASDAARNAATSCAPLRVR